MGHATMVICGVILLLLAVMVLLALTDPDRKRNGVTLDTEYNIRPVTVRPRQPATPVHRPYEPISSPDTVRRSQVEPPTRAYGGLVVDPQHWPEPLNGPGSPSGVSRPYLAPVPTQASKVHDRHHCPGCMCRR